MALPACSLFDTLDANNQSWQIDEGEMGALDMKPDLPLDMGRDLGKDLGKDITPDLDMITDMPDLKDMKDMKVVIGVPTLIATPSTQNIKLTWTMVEGATKYELSKDNNQWQDVGTALEYIDTDLTPHAFGHITLNATQGTKRNGVYMSVSGIPKAPQPHKYRVRAMIDMDEGQPSNEAMATRKLVEQSSVYEFSSNATGPWATTQPIDTAAPETGEHRFYRWRVKHEGIDEYITPVVEGWRGAVLEIVAGHDTICAYLNDNTVRCWGANFTTSTGVGHKKVVGDLPGTMPPLPTPTEPFKRFGKSTFTNMCIVTNSNKAQCWGENNLGQLGGKDLGAYFGDKPNDPLPIINLAKDVMDVQAGYEFICALNIGGTVTCWGSNQYGKLGLNVDTAIVGEFSGEYPPTQNIAGPFVEQIAVGYHHVCAKYVNNTVTCWGFNEVAQLGIGTMDQSVGLSSNTFTKKVTINNARHVYASEEHSCIINTSNKVQCWGEGSTQKINGGTPFDPVGDQPADMPPAQMGFPGNIIQLALGSDNTCALSDQGDVFCVGSNQQGQRGIESNNSVSPIERVGLRKKATQIVITSSAQPTACALLEDGNVHCWGSNLKGQLGREKTSTQLSALGDASGEKPNFPVILWK